MDRRPSARCASTRAMTSASNPSPAAKTNQRGTVHPSAAASSVPDALAVPSDTSRLRPARSEARISAVASTGSRDLPSARENTLVDPPGNGGEHRQVRGGALLQQPVHHLVDGSVAADGHDEVDALGGRLCAELSRVTAVAGLDDVQLELAGQGTDQHVTHLRGGTGRRRIDHHERAHGPQANHAGPDSRGERRCSVVRRVISRGVNEPAGMAPQPPRRRSDRLFGAAAAAVRAPACAGARRWRRGRFDGRPWWSASRPPHSRSARSCCSFSSSPAPPTASPGRSARSCSSAPGRRCSPRPPSGCGGWPRGRVGRSSSCSCCWRRWPTRRRSRPVSPRSELPVLVLVAAELYLLATPESRLAYVDR